MLCTNVLIESLRELASKELQLKLWVNGDAGQMSSYIEAICGVFDNGNVTTALEKDYLQDNFSAELCAKTEQLKRALSRVPADLAPIKAVNHPDMESIRSLSRELLDLFQKELRNE